MTRLAPNRTFAPLAAPRRYLRSRTYDLRHLRLELAIEPERRLLRGTATLHLSPINDGCRDLRFDLASNLEVASVRQVGGRQPTYRHDADELHLQLAKPVDAGREIEIVVAYQGSPRRGLYFVGPDASFPHKPVVVWSQGQDEDSRFWFPCWDSPNEKATTEMIVTVREPYRVISNGKLVRVESNRRRRTRTYHWHEAFPHPAYLVSLVIGDFVEVSEPTNDTELLYYVPASARDSVPRTFGRTPAMLRYFAAALDYPYPFEKYSQVVVPDFLFGGMENISATTLTDAVLLDKTAALDAHADWLISHELAHQWWGNLLTCKEWSHAWLNEGFATYFECLFSEHHLGRDAFLWQVSVNAQAYFAEDADKYRRPIVERRYTKPIEIFDSHLYEKGALVLHMLRFELGDELFWKALRHYVRKHQFGNVETTDLKVAIEEATGRHLDGFFDQWVYAAGFPHLDVSWSWDDRGQVRLQVEQTQVGNEGMLFDFPLEVELGLSPGAVRHRVRVSEARQVVHLPSRERPRFVRVDPDHWILKRLHFEPGRDALLAQLAAATDLFGQIDAAKGLGRFVGDAAVLKALGRALRGARFYAVRGALAQAVAEVGGDSARDLLLDALGHRDLRARRLTVRALALFKDDAQVAKQLQALWRREKSYFVRAEILLTLCKTRASEAWELCRQALALDSFRDVIRAAALKGMGLLEDERGVDVALEYARYGHSRWSRDAAMATLAGLGQLAPGRARRIQEALEENLRDRSFFAQIAAADALGKLGRPAAIVALHRLETADVDGRLQKAAREAINKLESEAKQPEAWQGLRQELETLRRENRDLRERVSRLESLAAGRPPRRRAAR